MFDEAMGAVERNRPIAAFVGDDWEKGLVGLVASGMVDALQVPALAATRIGDVIHGSGRSVPGFDLGRAVIAAVQAGLLLGGGGHAAACGFQCAPEQWESFRLFLEEDVLRSDQAATNHVDMVIDVAALNVDEIGAFSGLAPYGQGWPQPVIGIPCTLYEVAVIGKNRDTIRVNAGFKGIAFRASHNGLMQLLESRGRRAIVIGEPVVSEFGGSVSAEMRIRDVVVL
jgi:single-stranded-DNA-specific exonuclease